MISIISKKPLKQAHPFVSALKKDWGSWLLILPAILIIYFLVLRPQILGTFWSFFKLKGYNVIEFIGLDNYKRVLTDTKFLKVLANTFQYVMWSVVIGFPLPILMAILLNEVVHFKNGFRFCLYFPSIIPGVAVSLMWYFLFYPNEGGLLNMILAQFGISPYVWLQDSKFTILYLVISATWRGAGATMMYYYAFLQGINKEVYEAAIIDGAGFFGRIRNVTLPHIYGIALLFLVRQIMGVFMIFEQPLQMTGGGPNGASLTLGLQIYNYGFVSGKAGLALALGGVAFLILMIVTLFYFRLNKKIESNL